MNVQTDINKISIHCTDSPDSSSYGMAEIELDHMARNFTPSSDGKYCGYHYVILRDGTICIGRPEQDVPCAVRGHNTGSIAVCWVGRESMTISQKQSFYTIVCHLVSKYGLNESDVMGHREFPGVTKTCPNLNMDEVRETIRGMRWSIS